MVVLRAVFFSTSSAAPGIWSLGEGVFHWNFGFLSPEAFPKSGFLFICHCLVDWKATQCMTRCGQEQYGSIRGH